MPVSKTQFITTWDTYYQYPFPEGYADVISGKGYWYPNLEIIGEAGLCYYQAEYGLWTKYDPNHPKCYYCGKFVKAGNWWKNKYTNPCMNCNEDLYPW